MDGVTTKTALADLLANGLTVDWVAPDLFLYTAGGPPNPDTVYTDLTPAVISGAAPDAIAWSAVGYDPTLEKANAVGTTVSTWAGPTAGGGPDILGWLLYTPAVVSPPADAKLLAAGQFPAAVSLTGPLDTVSLSVAVAGDGTVTVEILG